MTEQMEAFMLKVGWNGLLEQLLQCLLTCRPALKARWERS